MKFPLEDECQHRRHREIRFDHRRTWKTAVLVVSGSGSAVPNPFQGLDWS